MDGRLPLRLIATGSLFACACGSSYECATRSSPFGLVADPVIFRVIGDRPVRDRDDTVAIFTHREQYDGDAKDVDFEHEEIVRLTARMGSSARVASVVKSHALLGFTVDATSCTKGIAATRQLDVVIPLTPLVPSLWVNRGPACRELP
jgi:hypothetical protein